MKYWIFVVTEHRSGDKVFSAREILDTRVKDGFWGLGEKTPNRKNLSQGDKVIFYVGLPEKAFAATATLNSPSFHLNDEQRERYGHGLQFYTMDYGVLLTETKLWDKPREVEVMIPRLRFIENKQAWYAYFQGGVREIPEEDFKLIAEGGESQAASKEDLEKQAEFALESHLEEFLFQNWSKIDWGSHIKLYTTDEQNGRQFPAGQWSIDFLAIDETTNDLVVIELKRGKTSDCVVGQLLRYMAWVKENIAVRDQSVRGIIIAREADEALKYAAQPLGDQVKIKTYKVNFHLQSFEP